MAGKLISNSTIFFIISLISAVACAQNLDSSAIPNDGAQIQPRVSFIGLAPGEILDNIHNSVELYQQTSADKEPSALSNTELLRLQAKVIQQVQQAAKPFGYYNIQVERQAGESAEAKTGRPHLVYKIDLGAPVIVRNIAILIDGPATEEAAIMQWRARYPLVEGAILEQPLYDQAKNELTRMARQLGYFDAVFEKQQIGIDRQRTNANINLHFVSGQRYRYEDFRVLWRDSSSAAIAAPYNRELIERYIDSSPGALYEGAKLQRIQSALSSSPFFSYVEVRPLTHLARDGQVPIQITLEAAKKQVYAANLGYGTDTGPRAGFNYENRRVNDSGHRFNSSIYLSQETQNLFGNYRIPLKSKAGDSLNYFASFTKEDTAANDLTTSTLGFDIVKIRDDWQWGSGLSYLDERYVEDSIQQSAGLLLPSISWQTLKADDIYSPNRGWKIASKLIGAHKNLLSDISFAQLSIDTRLVYSVGSGERRGRILGRTQFAGTLIEGSDSLPSSFRFLAGGDNSVRGYKFETLGITDSSGSLTGGKHLVTASLEYEQPIKGAFALAAFIDVGDAFDDSLDLKRGLGAGARWRFPFGAFKIDVASALDIEGRPLRFHITFGTDL